MKDTPEPVIDTTRRTIEREGGVVHAPSVSITEAPTNGVFYVGVQADDNDSARGGRITLTQAALDLLPGALARALAERQAA